LRAQSERFLVNRETPENPDKDHTGSVTILGLGNVLLSDEGVGVHVLHILKSNYVFTPHIELVDGGTMGLDLLPIFQERNRILILDAVDFKKDPGYIGILEGQKIPSVLNSKFSAHHIGLSDLLFTAKLTRDTLPTIYLIGIQPGSLAVGLEMTKEVLAQLDHLIALVLRSLRDWGVDSKKLACSSK
jgi:hydrogenase maturation protease